MFVPFPEKIKIEVTAICKLIANILWELAESKYEVQNGRSRWKIGLSKQNLYSMA